MDKQKRIEAVNEMLRAIADCGRRFFYCETHDRYASMEVDQRGKVWYVDDYTGKRIYTHYKYDWRGFSHGGTMRGLIIAFREYITRGQFIHPKAFGPWPDHICVGDPWGYGEDMHLVRNIANRLGLISH